MIPVKLTINNFMCFSKGEILFDKFESALIIGKINNNLDISNGSGKSSIFNSIEYCLFNDFEGIKLDKIIRDGQKSCYVEFTFNINNIIYKINRSRSIDGVSSVQVYKLLDSSKDSWKDLSGRRNQDTENQIKKIVKINQKNFRNSVHFAQRDFSGITNLTPGERKNVLKQIFDLGVYSKLEKISKIKLSELLKENTKLNQKIDFLSNTNCQILDIQNKIDNVIILKNNIKYKDINNLIIEKDLLLDQIKIAESNYPVLLKSKTKTEKDLDTLNSDFNNLNIKLNNLNKDLEDNNKKISLIPKNSNNLENDLITIKNKTKENSNKITDLKINFRTIHNEIINLEAALGKERCESCLQDVSRDHCENLNNKIDNLSKTKSKLKEEIDILEIELKSDIDKEKRIESQIKQKNADINTRALLLNNIYNINNNIDSINKNIISLDKNIKELSILLNYTKSELLKFDISKIENLKKNLKIIDLKINQENENNNLLKEKELSFDKELSVLNFKLNELEENKKELDKINLTILELNKEIKLYELTTEAFSSKGIPSFIINNLLDDLQTIANEFSNKIKPGLQIQFLLQKENSSGEEIETLDIKYFFNGKEREFWQLSGAMKFNVTFSLKLALAILIQKLLDVNIKFFLFDEIDSSLDKFSSDEFTNIIKELQNEYKILLITHGDSLKDKFNSKIIVDQNINGVSSIIQD